MSGISSTLSISRTAIASQQYGLNVTGNNIANVNNPDYSVQNADQKNRKPAPYAGFFFGTGVDTFQIQQSVDKLLEQRLTNAKSNQTSFEEQESYMRILEGFFDPDSKTSISSVLTEFWSSWHDLSNNPTGSSERVAVYESGAKLASRFEATVLDMDDLAVDINADVNSAVNRINSLTEQIAVLNQEIMSAEIHRSANDQRDQRNRLVDELGELVDIDTFEKYNGTIMVNIGNQYTVVNGVDNYRLEMENKDIYWQTDEGTRQRITDTIDSGRVGGLLDMRDEVIPKFRTEIDELAREMIWAINYQHSQGAGLSYYKDSVTGDYATDDSRWLTSYGFGDKIDFSKDFTMWIEDKTTADTEYTRTQIDMGVSEARISNWQGIAPGGVQSIYRLTVMDDAILGDLEVIESDGDGLSLVHGSAADVDTALDSAIAEQTISVYDGPSGTQTIKISNTAGAVKQSAASIAAALSEIAGVTAHASENSLSFDTIGITNAQDGDEIIFSLHVDGLVHEQKFVRDSSLGSIDDQFEDVLLAAAAAVNDINEDDDLSASGLTITSSAGRTLGVQDFEVRDNASVRLDNFLFNPGDTAVFNVDTMNAGLVDESRTVSVDLNGIDTTDQAALSQAFADALSEVFPQGSAVTIEHDPLTHSVFLRTLDGTDIRLTDAGTAIGGSVDISALDLGTGADLGNVDNVLDFTGLNDTVRFNAVSLDTDSVDLFKQDMPQLAVTVIDNTNAGPGNKAAVTTGTVTAMIEPGMTLYSNVAGAGTGGLFSDHFADSGSSVLTFGGPGGFSNFTTAGGEVISFDLDGTTIDFSTTSAGGTTELELAMELEAELNDDLAAGGVDQFYQVVRTGSSVSVIKDRSLESPIRITDFSDTLDNNAQIRVSTGTGTGTSQPENDRLEAGNVFRDSATSSLYDDEGIIMWERLDQNGLRTGASGLLNVEDEEQVDIIEGGMTTLSFDISKGSLVAGNVLTVNTDTEGRPDPLNFRITGQANSINDIYRFKVVSGGKVGHLPATGDEPLVIEWSNSRGSGTFTIEGHDPPYTPGAAVEVPVDGMNMKFYDGTLFTDDTFTVTTGDTGVPQMLTDAGEPTGERLSDWHWTIDSFAGQFNREAAGMKAWATNENRLKFAVSESYYTIQNVEYSGSNGFSEANCNISVTDWGAMNIKASDLRFERSSGSWGVLNDPTGGTLQLLPPGGDDDGFGVDFSGDGLADIRIDFKNQVTGDGFVEFDMRQRNSRDIGYAFSDDASDASGLAAAAGMNNFFKGTDSMTMEMNEALKDTKFVAAAKIDSETGVISQGDNSNALAMADVQYQAKTMKLWTYDRGNDAWSSTTSATLDDYYNQLISSLGIESRGIKNSREFADMMTNSLTAQRDSVSAVSLDEEMIKLIKYQHAFSAASKLLTVADEMLNTLIAVR